MKLRSLIAVLIFSFTITAISYAANVQDTIIMYKEKVDAAATVFDTVGLEKAAEIFMDKEGKYFFDKGKGYVYIIDESGTVRAHAAKPALVGKKLMKLKDIDGYPIIQSVIDIGAKYKSGWVQYKWPKPGEVKASPKTTYSRQVIKDGKKYVVCAGVYDIALKEVYKVYPAEKSKILDY